MICRECGRSLEPGARFCASCGTPVAAACASCGETLPVGAQFCPSCGTPADGGDGASGRGAVRGVADGAGRRERKVATMLFADLVGFTPLNEGSDPELVQALVGEAFARLSGEVERYEGTVEKFAGDAILALFGVPNAHEDDPERAVRAALEMQSAMSALAAARRSSVGPSLELRVGVETGEVLVDLGRVSVQRDRLVTGDPVNVAARLQSAAAPGSVLVGPGTYAATREVIEYQEMAPLELKGKSLPVPAWRAVRVRSRRGGLRTPLGIEAPLIGRDEELNLLKQTVRRTVAEGRPHIVTVIGDAGVGKSRLAWELEKYLDGLPEAYHWRKGRCLSYGQPSLGGLIEVIRTDAKIRDDEDDESTWRLLERRLAEIGLAGDAEVRRALGVLLGEVVDLAPARDDLFEAIRRYLEAIARVAPLVLVVEDIHWADEGMLDLLDFLARWGEAPMVLLCQARHELLERRPGWGGGLANSATIMLEPLAPSENEALLDALLPGSLPPAFRARLVAVAEGNPLFCEELVRMLIDRGIARRTDHGWELLAPVDELRIPGSIQALLAARLDGLPASEKRVTQAAAVVGRIFWDAVLAHVVAGASPELERLLRALRAKELVVPREPSSLADSREYGFRHVLIRDVAYESVPKADRAAQHLAVAEWAEQRLAAREDELVELLASHYASALDYREELPAVDAGELAELRRRAYDYARRAGHRAAELWEAGAAMRWYRRALEQAERLDLPADERAGVALEYLDVAVFGERVADALAVAEQARELIGVPADEEAAALLARVEVHLARFLYSSDRADDARTLLTAALSRVGNGRPSADRARLRHSLGWLTWRAYSAADAVPILEQAVAEAQASGRKAIERLALHDLGVAKEFSGDIGSGVALIQRSLELAREANDQTLVFRCYINLPALMEVSGFDVRGMRALAGEGLERARRGGQRFFAAWIASNMSSFEADSGNFERARALAAETRELAAAVGDASLIGLGAGLSAYVEARAGRLDAALGLWQHAMSIGPVEPQSDATVALMEGHLLWPRDQQAAVRRMAELLTGATNAQSEARQLLRMALRTGQLDEVSGVLDTLKLAGAHPRPLRERGWREALLAKPSEERVERLRAIAEEFLADGYRMIAADAYADAALLAAHAGLAEAETLALARRASGIYEECGAVPLLADPLEEVAALSRGG